MINIPAIPATDDMLFLVHSEDHIKNVKSKGKLENEKGKACKESSDCYENMYSSQAAYMAAGGTVEAVRAVCRSDQEQTETDDKQISVNTAFCIVRPPGHHAFCG